MYKYKHKKSHHYTFNVYVFLVESSPQQWSTRVRPQVTGLRVSFSSIFSFETFALSFSVTCNCSSFIGWWWVMFIVFFWGVWRKNLVILGRHVGEVETKDMNGQVYPWAIHLIKMSQRRKPFRPVDIIYTTQVWNHQKRFCTVWTLAAIVSSLKWWHGLIIHNFNYNSGLLHKLGWVSHISRRQMPLQYLATLDIWYDNMTISQPTKNAQGECENELQNFSPHCKLINTSALYTLNNSSKWKHVTYQ